MLLHTSVVVSIIHCKCCCKCGNVQSGSESGNEKTPNGATYDPQYGRLTLTFASAHGLSTNDTITLDNNSLTFTCSSDNHASQQTYPRPTDPIAGVTTAVTVTSTTELYLNVGAHTEYDWW